MAGGTSLSWARRAAARPGYRWYALGLTTYTQAAAIIISAATGPLAPLLQSELGITRTEIGLFQSVLALTMTGAALAGGRAADRLGERLVLIASGLVMGVASLTTVFVGSFGALLLVALALGLGSGVQNPAGSAAIMRWFPPRRRGVAMGIRQTGVPFGGVFAAIALPWVAISWGWRAAYVVAGLLSLLGAAVVAASYFDPPRETGPGAARMRSLRDLVADRRLWLLSVTYNGQIVAQYAATVYLVLFLHEAHQFSLAGAAALLALTNVTAIGARIGWGLLSDSVFAAARRPVFVIVIGLTLAGTLAAAALPREAPGWLVVAFVVLLGLSAFSWTGIWVAMTVELSGAASAASAVAWVQFLGGVGSLAGPPIFGYLVDSTGSYRIAWLATALPVVLGLVAILRLREGPGGGR
jgi:MFS family permease